MTSCTFARFVACNRLHRNIARNVWGQGDHKRVGPVNPSGQRVQSLPDLGSFGLIRRLRSQQHRSRMAGTSSSFLVPNTSFFFFYIHRENKFIISYFQNLIEV